MEHLIMDSQFKKRRRISVCVGCRDEILDQYILRVSPDLEWHAACLKCVECGQMLDESCTCFVRQEKTYCKRDYARLFGARCGQCSLEFKENDLVMKARNKIYHMDCFRCVACNRKLMSGDEFCLRDSGLYCKADYDALERTSENDINLGNDNDSNDTLSNNNNNNNIEIKEVCDDVSPTSNGSSHRVSGSRAGIGRVESRSRSHKSDHKTTRVRTVLNEKQLHTLRTCYNANPRPDALMKEQLVEMTGLSPRVIRVWFQNKRCKDKKRTNLMKHIQQQQQEKGDPCDMDDNMWICAKGVPMVAASPVRHEAPMNVQLASIEVHQYPAPPWKALSDFALQSDLDQPPFQQLVSSFAESSSGCDDDDDAVVCLKEPSSARLARTRVYLEDDDHHATLQQSSPMGVLQRSRSQMNNISRFSHMQLGLHQAQYMTDAQC